MIDYQDKVVIVTGSTRGIGHQIALRFAELGAKVVVSSRKAEDCQRVEEEFKARGYECLGMAADVSFMEDCKALAAKALETFGQVDVLVNNAGITLDNLMMRMKEDQWDDIMSINLKSVFNMSQSLLRNFLKLRGGRIINITSVVGQMGNAGQANYAASKAGIIGFTKSLAKEVGSRGITVNAVAPGYIATDMTDAITDDAKEKMFSQIPLGRIGEPEEVANLVAFLGSDQAGYITGQVLMLMVAWSCKDRTELGGKSKCQPLKKYVMLLSRNWVSMQPRSLKTLPLSMIWVLIHWIQLNSSCSSKKYLISRSRMRMLRPLPPLVRLWST